MIKVDKDYNDVPDVLNSESLVKKALIKPKNRIGWAEALRVYNDSTVRGRLRRIYHDKCAYCESKNVLPAFIIDHYRPKDHYYWLVIEWSNLLFACETCISSKNSRFPILNEDRRIISPPGRTDWSANSTPHLAESPLLLNPEIDDPENFLAFHRDGRIYAIGDNPRGKRTIRVLNLNRTTLVAARKEKIDRYNSLFEKKLDEISYFKRFV